MTACRSRSAATSASNGFVDSRSVETMGNRLRGFGRGLEEGATRKVGRSFSRRKLVSSLARPGGNLTGVNFLNTELAAKRSSPAR